MVYYVSSGEVSTGIVLNNDSMYVYDSGSANNTTVNSSGKLYVSSGGTLTDSLISSGGKLYVYSHGLTSRVTLIGNQAAISGGTCVDDIVSDGGTQDVFSGGLVSRSVVSSGGRIRLAGGVASDVVISSGGVEQVRSTTNDNPSYDFNALIDGGLQRVFSSNGGFAYSATVRNGGVQSVYSGGVVSDTTVSDGVLMVNTGGSAYRANILSGGRLRIHSDGVISGAEIASGGSMYLSSGAVLQGNILLGGSMTLRDAVNATDAVVTLDLRGRTASDTALIGNYALLGNTTLAISVTSAQTGVYKLAANAASFDRSFAVNAEDSGDTLTLTLGKGKSTETRTYTLALSGSNILCLSVGTVSSGDDTNYPVMSAYQEKETDGLTFGLGNISEFNWGDGDISSGYVCCIGGLKTSDWTITGNAAKPYIFIHDKIIDAEKADTNSLDDYWCGPMTETNLLELTGHLNRTGWQSGNEFMAQIIANGDDTKKTRPRERIFDNIASPWNVRWGSFDRTGSKNTWLQQADEQLRSGNYAGWFQVQWGTPDNVTGNHAMTLLGFTYDTSYAPNDPRYYSGVVLADSDDNKKTFDHACDAPELIKVERIVWDDTIGNYWFRNGAGFLDNVWTIRRMETPGTADLTWYQPNDWSCPMTVNTRRDAAHDRALLRTDDELLVNFAVTNTGAAESGKFYISLYVDDTLKETFKVENLSFNNIAAFQNFSLGTLSAGTHEIRAVIDSDDNVVEEYDANNIYRKTVVVTEAAAQLQVSSAGGFVVSSGDSAANFALLSRARVHLRGDDATATDAVVSSGGTLFVSSGGMLIDSLIDSAGKLYVYSHGLTSQVTLIGNQAAISGGTCVDDIVSDGGTQDVFSGGLVSRSVVSSGGRIRLAGGVASDVVISSGGVEQVRSTTNDNPSYDFNALIDGGLQRVFSSNGGFAYSATVRNGGVQSVYSGGVVSDTTVSDGVLMVNTGGSAYRANILSGGRLRIHSDGVISGAEIASGGSMYLSSGAVLQGNILLGGSMTLRDAVNATDAVVTLDLRGRTASDTDLIGNYTLLGDTTLVISVASDQAAGVYKLASNAANFASAMSLAVGAKTYADVLTVGGSYSDCGRDYSLELSDNMLTLTVAGDPIPPASGNAGDLNADGRADIVMTIAQNGHGAYGATGAWLIQEDQTPVWGDLSNRNEGWVIFGMGWTSADKPTNDVYIKNEGNLVGAWTTDDDGLVTGWETIGEFASDAQVLGLGDFNGNGQSDLLLRAANGAVGCFFTDGQGWNYFQSLGDEWKLTAIGDLNGDGRDDVVLKHDAGFAGSWLTQEDGTPIWADLDTLPEGFEIVGAGDFNGDGTDDVLLKSGGYYGAWLVQNGNAVGWMGLGDFGDAAVEQIADFNGDGMDDLRIRTAAGDLGAQLVMGEDTLDWKYYGSVGAEWSTSLAALN